MVMQLKRVYDPPDEHDGQRILIDRLWPRGLKKSAAHVDLWLRDVAPSDGLRKWFGHDPAKWAEFKKRYFAELRAHADAVAALRAQKKAGPMTLVYAAKDSEHNNAVALKEYLSGKG